MTPWETLKIAFGNCPYWHPYFASFAGFALERDQLLVELGFLPLPAIAFSCCRPRCTLTAFPPGAATMSTGGICSTGL